MVVHVLTYQTVLFHDHVVGQVYVEGATQVDVHTAGDVAALLDTGAAVRATGAHKCVLFLCFACVVCCVGCALWWVPT